MSVAIGIIITSLIGGLGYTLWKRPARPAPPPPPPSPDVQPPAAS